MTVAISLGSGTRPAGARQDSTASNVARPTAGDFGLQLHVPGRAVHFVQERPAVPMTPFRHDVGH